MSGLGVRGSGLWDLDLSIQVRNQGLRGGDRCLGVPGSAPVGEVSVPSARGASIWGPTAAAARTTHSAVGLSQRCFEEPALGAWEAGIQWSGIENAVVEM